MKFKEIFIRPSALKTANESNVSALTLVNYLPAILLFVGIFYFAVQSVSYNWSWIEVWKYRSNFMTGLGVTLAISSCSLILSMFIGTCIALLLVCRVRALSYTGKLYVELIRSTPLLVQVLVFYYLIANAFSLENRFVCGIIILSIFTGAYIAEIIRSGIENVGKAQFEASLSVGFTSYQKYRYVIFPQTVRMILPSLTGQFVNLVKDSSILSIIAVSEFTMNAQAVNANTYSTLECYIPLAIGYMSITIPISLLTKRLEKRFKYAA